MDNVFYFKSINAIGGVESFLFYLSKLFKNMVVYYKEGDPNQVERIARNVEIHKWYGETVRCKHFFGNYGLDDVLPYLEAEHKHFIIHCDYKKNKLCKPILYPGFDYIAVSKLAGESFKEMTGIDYELIYNPVVIDKPQVKKSNKLRFISATRLSGEKGGWRIDTLAEMLDKANIDYDWDIYSNKSKKIKIQSEHVHLKQPKLDLSKEMAEATYLVQLSDHEAFGLSVAEALTVGTPVIVTDIPAFHEIGCNESNSIMLDLTMSNVDIEKIVNSKFNFTYTPPKSNWNKYLDNNRHYAPDELINIEVLKKRYYDKELGRWLERGNIVQMPRVRASYLEAKPISTINNKGYVKCCLQ